MRSGLVPSLLAAALLTFSCTSATAPPRIERSPEQEALDGVEPDDPKRCSRTKTPHEREEVRGVAFARGTGPVFVGLGTPNVVRFTVDTKQHDGWHYYKTLWAISPKYEGAVKVTGEQLDGSNELRFNAASGFPGEKLTVLEFEESDAAEWRYGPSDTLIRSDGCYAFRIEGDGFVDWVTFIARS